MPGEKIMRKIIFLDIDGVLNSHDWFERKPKLPPDSPRRDFIIEMLDPKAVQLFHLILVETNAEVVLSSTWRLHDEDREIIKEKVVDFIDVTPVSDSRIRGAEIYMWVDKNLTPEERKEMRYAILDDDSDMLLWQKDHFFQTSFMHGLTKEIADKVIYHLNCS
jgi:hypothetical protein